MLFALLKFRAKSHSVKILFPLSNINQTTQDGNENLLYLPIFSLTVFFLPSDIQVLFFHYTFLPVANFKVVLLVTNSLVFLQLRLSWFPSIPGDIFIRYRILGLHLFSFSTWKMVSSFLWTLWFWGATHYHLSCVSTVGRFFLFLSAIKISSFVFNFGICFCCVSVDFLDFFL